MISRRTRDFHALLQELPHEVQLKAKETYRIWSKDARHPSLHFKKVHPELPIWSVRITQNYRAVGVLRGEVMVWFWVGHHSDYERLLRSF